MLGFVNAECCTSAHSAVSHYTEGRYGVAGMSVNVNENGILNLQIS